MLFRSRSALLPDVPTMSESGLPQVGFNPDAWQGFFGPAGMASAHINKLNREIGESLNAAPVRASLGKMAFDTKLTTPQEFSVFLAAQLRKMPPLLQAAGLKAE